MTTRELFIVRLGLEPTNLVPYGVNMSLKLAGVLLIAGGAVIVGGCGKDEADFNSLKDEVGIINGNFNLRLGTTWRDKIDAVESKMDDIVPGSSGLLLRRFIDDGDSATGSGDTKFSDLFKIKLPGTGSKIANQIIFGELVNATGEGGVPYFDLVDNNKFVKKPAYVAATDANADEMFGDQYYLDMIKWEQAVAQISTTMLNAAVPVVVAVLDTGVNAKHEDLADVMWKNNDASVGYDATIMKAVGSNDSDDGNGHGTHVAGIIGGTGSNGKGIHGVAGIPYPSGTGTKYLAEIMNVQVLNDNGAGTSEEISSGIKWAVDQHKKQKASAGRSNQKLVINMSLGGPFDATGFKFKTDANGKPIFEDDMINYAAANDDVLVIVAAGNDTCGIGGQCEMYQQSFYQAYYFPCSYKNVLCVAATTHEDEVAGFSNRKGSVGIAAPGYQILSTSKVDGEYVYYSGTSQATPVTSGAAAVVWSMYPNFKGPEIKAILQKTASKIEVITGEILSKDGRLNLDAAMKFAAKLKTDSASPTTTDPDPAILSNDVVAPKNKPATGSVGPKDKSPTAQPGTDPESKGDGSANGCAVVGGGHTGLLALLFALMLPVFFRRF
jgi:subtilisin family serine protease